MHGATQGIVNWEEDIARDLERDYEMHSTGTDG